MSDASVVMSWSKLKIDVSGKYSTNSPDSIINDKAKEELELTAPVAQSAKPAVVTAEDKPAPTSDFNW